MGTVYSYNLFSKLAIAAGEYVQDVPAGTKWVVRDIVASNITNGPLWPLKGITFYGNLAAPIYIVGQDEACGSTDFHWRGNQVIESGGSLVVEAFDVDWAWTISGFQLSLP